MLKTLIYMLVLSCVKDKQKKPEAGKKTRSHGGCNPF